MKKIILLRIECYYLGKMNKDKNTMPKTNYKYD